MRIIGLPHRGADHALAVDQRAVTIEYDQIQRFVSALPLLCHVFYGIVPRPEKGRKGIRCGVAGQQHRNAVPQGSMRNMPFEPLTWDNCGLHATPSSHRSQTGGFALGAPLESPSDSTATVEPVGKNLNVEREGVSRDP